MQRKILTTADGSKTIHIEDWNEQYHSVHGAIQEANHVYIKHGLLFFYSEFISKPLETESATTDEISILEIGFGTGLNALLTALKSEVLKVPINYVGVEAFPVSSNELEQLNYSAQLNLDKHIFQNLHDCSWEVQHQISDTFKITKQQKFFDKISEENTYDIIYFDAFGARVQPELWTEAIFKIMYEALKPKGVLTTYAAIGHVRRTLTRLGFDVQRLEGPPGKRHMLRAVKR